MVRGVFTLFPPDWFITLMWNDFPRDPITCVSHTRHWKNVLLSDVYNVGRCECIPDFPRRLGMMVFHERKRHCVNGKWVTVFHTHIHLYNDTRKLTSSVGGHNKFPRRKLQRHVNRLFKGDKEGFRGLDVRKWEEDKHLSYNFKDLYEFKYEQDGDLVLDYENSDIPKYRRKLNVKNKPLYDWDGWCSKNNQSLLR